MVKVVLTIGPQHIGKSTFCHKVIKENPEIVLISRDVILEELFGSAYLDSYSGGHYVALEKMWEIVRENLHKKVEKIILDSWNGPDKEREVIIEKLRALNVENVGAWYFKTHRETCLEWHMKKALAEEPKKDEKWEKIRLNSARESFLKYYDFFYKNANVNCEQGFDFIREINPLEKFSIEELF